MWSPDKHDVACVSFTGPEELQQEQDIIAVEKHMMARRGGLQGRRGRNLDAEAGLTAARRPAAKSKPVLNANRKGPSHFGGQTICSVCLLLEELCAMAQVTGLLHALERS